jgi:hypothetical protein
MFVSVTRTQNQPQAERRGHAEAVEFRRCATLKSKAMPLDSGLTPFARGDRFRGQLTSLPARIPRFALDVFLDAVGIVGDDCTRDVVYDLARMGYIY